MTNDHYAKFEIELNNY